MITIIHGENIVTSRNFLNSLIGQARRKEEPIIRINKDNPQIDNLVNILEPGLFTQKKLIIVDRFQKFSPQDQEDIAKTVNQVSPQNHLIIWANKKLLIKTLKLFPKKKDHLFKASSQVFKFLDSLSPSNRINSLKLLNQTLRQDNIGLVFHLLIIRTEDLIIIKTDHQDQLKIALWQKNRLIAQAKDFSLPVLKNLLEQLILLDYQNKRGRLFYSLEFGLELLIAKL